LALVLEHDGGFTPPTEKSKPRSSDADYSSRSGDSPMKAFPLGRDPSERLDIDALRSIWTEMCGNPQQLVALVSERSCGRAGFCTVAKVPVPLVGEWRVITVEHGQGGGINRLIHSELDKGFAIQTSNYVA
jgi:hypothetical protein